MTTPAAVVAAAASWDDFSTAVGNVRSVAAAVATSADSDLAICCALVGYSSLAYARSGADG